jgi:hypothetical protein
VLKGTSDVEMDGKKKLIRKSRPSSKKRRFLKLLKANPEREAKPLDIRDLHIKSVKQALLKSKEVGSQLSRG